MQEKRFRTKTGYCDIFSDRIVLTRSGELRDVSDFAADKEIYFTLMIYGFVVVELIFLATERYKTDQIFQAVWYGAMSLFFIYGGVTSLNNSATSIIYRDKIKDLKLRRGIRGVTRSRFEVIFENERGRNKKRLIMLPGSLTQGEQELERAIAILKEEGLFRQND